MIYLDTSCLVKLLRIEEDSEAIAMAISRERSVIVSNLAELEGLIELKAGYKAGDYSLVQWRKLEAHLQVLRNQEPFHFKHLPAGIWDTAFRQHRNSREIHCRTLDRLHLAALEKLGITRLMTHDSAQAKAARELEIEVVQPGR
jgi:predicted nucleic acid-binding protein